MGSVPPGLGPPPHCCKLQMGPANDTAQQHRSLRQAPPLKRLLAPPSTTSAPPIGCAVSLPRSLAANRKRRVETGTTRLYRSTISRQVPQLLPLAVRSPFRARRQPIGHGGLRLPAQWRSCTSGVGSSHWLFSLPPLQTASGFFPSLRSAHRAFRSWAASSSSASSSKYVSSAGSYTSQNGPRGPTWWCCGVGSAGAAIVAWWSAHAQVFNALLDQ